MVLRLGEGDTRKEADSFAKRILKKCWVVRDYVKEEIMAMGYYTSLFEPVPSPQKIVCSIKYRAMGRGPISFISVLIVSIPGAR